MSVLSMALRKTLFIGALISLAASRLAALEAPTELSASTGVFTDRVEITWSAVTNAAGYHVFRSTAADTNTAAPQADTTNTNYADTNAAAGILYFYWIQAFDEQTNSAFSPCATGYCILPAPAQLHATTGTLTRAVDLTWSPVESAAHYEIWRHSATSEPATSVCITTLTTCALSDRFIHPQHRYAYRVRAVSSNAIAGAFSATAEGWRKPAAALDYDGDGKADPVIYNAAAASWHFYLSDRGYSNISIGFGGGDYTALAGDYDGDGLADPTLYHATNGLWIISGSVGDYHLNYFYFGSSAYRPVAGDYDGDGKADPALYDAANAIWSVRLSLQAYQETAFQFGGRAWQAIPSDYDGDGKSDPAIYNVFSGEWRVALSSAGYITAQAFFGGPWHIPVPADYDGDGKADPAVHHKLSGTWQALLSGTHYACASGVLGGTGCQPVPADYDGDGKSDLVIRQIATGKWSGLFSSRHYQPLEAQLVGAGGAWRTIPTLSAKDFVLLSFGDSVTYGCGSSSDGPATGYPILLERKLNNNFGAYFASINAGVDGEDTGEGIGRLPATIERYAPDLVLLMEGINDLGASNDYDRLETNLRYMVNAALARGIPVVLATISPVISNEYKDRSAQYTRIVAFNPRIYNIAGDFGIPVASVFEAITAVSGWQTSLMDQPSANHPNDTGYLYVRDAFYNVINAGLNNGEYY